MSHKVLSAWDHALADTVLLVFSMVLFAAAGLHA